MAGLGESFRVTSGADALLPGACCRERTPKFQHSRGNLGIYRDAAGAKGVREVHEGFEGQGVRGHAAPQADALQRRQPRDRQKRALGAQVGDV